MPRIKRHNSVLTDKLVKQIEYVLPKLKYSVYVNSIRSWLENFEEGEVDLALDFLFYLEYVTFPELQFRLEDQLKRIIKEIDTDILLVPYAKYPKSNDVIMYLITKLDIFKKNNKRIFFTKDVINYQLKNSTTLVFVDDFIGSGKSFNKWYSKNKMAKYVTDNPLVSNQNIILAAIAMEEGRLFLNEKFKGIKIYAEIRNKIFSEKESPFNLTGSRIAMNDLCLKYGKNLQVGFERPSKKIFLPLGYEESESLIAFDYGTPNNTLSIIWAENTWAPIFPRFSKSRIVNAKRIKTEVDFYLGVMTKIGFEVNEDFEIKIGKKGVLYNKRTDYSCLVVILLKERKYHEIMICQILGITLNELNLIYKTCRKKRLLDMENNLTKLALAYIKTIKIEGRKYKFRENIIPEMQEKTIFIPKSFDGKT